VGHWYYLVLGDVECHIQYFTKLLTLYDINCITFNVHFYNNLYKFKELFSLSRVYFKSTMFFLLLSGNIWKFHLNMSIKISYLPLSSKAFVVMFIMVWNVARLPCYLFQYKVHSRTISISILLFLLFMIMLFCFWVMLLL
jgi:hypothetical protein